MKNKIYSHDEIKTYLEPIFRRYGVKIVILFGSYAEGNATEKSDIDLMVDSEWRDGFMLYELRIKEALRDGKAEGEIRGEGYMGQLCAMLSNEGRNEDIQRVAVDKEYREELYKEFGIK